ncbi:MAG: sulfate adenylyltransferase subunit 2 [Candidatus Azotimanducaceae bacterium]|jgi:sulfate adenylyltransferase subunit 2
MDFPENSFAEPLDECLLWDSQLLRSSMNALGENVSLRTVERMLKERGALPDPRAVSDVLDDAGRPLNQLVRRQLEETGRKKRHGSLVVQQHRFESRYVLMANDARKGRKWLWFDKPPGADALREFLDALAQTFGKKLLIWPHAEVASLAKVLAKSTGAHLIHSKGIDIQLALTAYGAEPAQALFLDSAPQTKKEHSMDMSHLDRLEAESMHIIREVMAESENPVMLYSIGKDSAVMLRLAEKAFYPSKPPFPLMHIDTRWKFQAMYEFRSQISEQTGMDLIVHINPDGVARNMNPFDHGSSLHTDVMKTQGLKQALDMHKFDAAFGGARRDEEKSRAKERVFSFRTDAHRWDPKNQRPELWNLYNGQKNRGESIRVFPLSNWTEIDIWQYIYRESIPIVPLYYAAERPVIERDGMLMMVDDDRLKLFPGEEIQTKKVRFRTLGCYPLTGAVESEADTLPKILLELLEARTSERQGRAIDKDSSGSMEKKKQEGYF